MSKTSIDALTWHSVGIQMCRGANRRQEGRVSVSRKVYERYMQVLLLTDLRE